MYNNRFYLICTIINSVLLLSACSSSEQVLFWLPLPTLSYTFSGATTGSGVGDGSGSTFNDGITDVMVIATNCLGADTCTFTVSVNDAENPTIICPADTTLATDSGLCTAASSSCTTNFGFQGIYMPSSWSFTQINADGSVDTTGAPGDISITGGNNGSGLPGNTNYSHLIPCDGNITFDWSYATTDGALFDYPQYSTDGGFSFTLQQLYWY